MNLLQPIKSSGKYDLNEIAFAFEKWGRENGLSFWR